MVYLLSKAEGISKMKSEVVEVALLVNETKENLIWLYLKWKVFVNRIEPQVFGVADWWNRIKKVPD